MASGTYSSTTGICTWSGWSGVTAADMTLSVTAQFDADSSGGSSHMSISYTLDGSTVHVLASATASVASATYTADVPAGTNLALVSVTAQSYSNAIRTGNSYAEGDITVSNLKIQ